MYYQPIPDNIPNPNQGSILKNVLFEFLDEPLYGIVLTPTCDFEREGPDYVQICGLVSTQTVTSRIRAALEKRVNDNAFRKSHVKQLLTRRLMRYHWLPPWDGIDYSMIADFQIVTSYDVKEIKQFEAVAYLASPFREEFASRYAAYLARVGVPDNLELEKWLDEAFVPEKKA